MSRKPSVYGLTAFALIVPMVTFAKDLNALVLQIKGWLNLALELIMALALVLFVWNVVMYLIKAADSAARKEAGAYIMWSVIGFFVVLSFWGIVNILISTFALDSNTPSSFTQILPGGHTTANPTNTGTGSGTSNPGNAAASSDSTTNCPTEYGPDDTVPAGC